jgi:FAD-linked oxidoreductase
MNMQRRDLLKSFVAASLCSAFPLSFAQASARALPWKNWSANQSCLPKSRIAPENIDQLSSILKGHNGTVRAVGSGHSFTALVPTDDTLLSLRNFTSVNPVTGSNQQADIGAGISLQQLGLKLDNIGQALINMPDIDKQTLAGSISTATHGTGRMLGSLSSYITELEFMDAQGDLHLCNKQVNPDLFDAARVGLGALGIITRVRMQNTQPFNLKRVGTWRPYEEAFAQAKNFADIHRNFEFYVIPFTGMTLSDSLDTTSAPVTESEELNSNDGLGDLKMARDYLGWSNKARELVLGSYMKTLEPSANIDHSFKIYSSERSVRFNEMEYHLPYETGIEALQEIVNLIERKFPEVFFPIECRFVKGDDCWLSPFYRRDSISIAVHRFFEEDYQPLFKEIEPIFRKYEGRPHWGKLNTLGYPEFASLYPRFKDFLAIRESLDPSQRFANDYLKKTFAL